MSAGYLRKCGTKQRHPTRKGAEDQRRSLVRTGGWTLSGSNTYACNQCGCFHAGRVGRTPRGRR